MIVYLVKFILCSSLFYLAYLALLEREKLHHLKRFYLLATLILALTIPLITFEGISNPTPADPKLIINFDDSSNLKQAVTTASTIEQSTILQNLVVTIYIVITSLLILRFCRNIYRLISSISNSQKLDWESATLIFNEKPNVPYSFMKYIFISKADYDNGLIAKEIMQHELTHVRQKHSVDVLFIELLQIFLWFNPALFFYRKAIQTNHEYLADENVLHYQDISTYQLILLQHISKQNGLTLTSQFNYLTIKKRLIMMTKNNPTKAVLSKQLLLLPVFAFAVFLFSTQTVAQEQKLKISQPQFKSNQFTKEGVSKEEMSRYKDLERKHLFKGNATKTGQNLSKISLSEKKLLESIYVKMSKAQQEEVSIFFIKMPAPRLPKNKPTDEQLQTYKNKEEYGVWVDRKRISNAKLENYNANDFKEVIVYKLPAKAKIKQQVSYNYQIELITNELSDYVYAKNKALEGKNLIAVRFNNDLKFKNDIYK